MEQVRWLCAGWASAVCVLASGACAYGQIEYEVTVIPTPEGFALLVPQGINESGQVVGYARIEDSFHYRAFSWTEDTGTVILPLPPGEEDAFALDVNDLGAIAGGDEFGMAWIFENGVYKFLGVVPGAVWSWAWGINNDGDAAGVSQKDYPDIYAFFYDSETDDIFAIADGRGREINELSQVVGSTGNTAFRWTPGVGIDLLIEQVGEFGATFGRGINDQGEICGSANNIGGPDAQAAWAYTNETGVEVIVVQMNVAVAWAINNHSVVVGSAPTGFIWSPQKGVRMLSDLVDPAKQVEILDAYDINDQGQIIGRGNFFNEPGVEAVLLTPIGGCPGDFNGDEALNVLDFVAFQEAFAAGDESADCDASGELNILDFVCFQEIFLEGCA